MPTRELRERFSCLLRLNEAEKPRQEEIDEDLAADARKDHILQILRKSIVPLVVSVRQPVAASIGYPGGDEFDPCARGVEIAAVLFVRGIVPVF